MPGFEEPTLVNSGHVDVHGLGVMQSILISLLHICLPLLFEMIRWCLVQFLEVVAGIF